MKLSEKAIKAVKADRTIIYELATKKDVHSGTIDRQLSENLDDGPLTLVSTIEFLAKRTKLKTREILVD